MKAGGGEVGGGERRKGVWTRHGSGVRVFDEMFVKSINYIWETGLTGEAAV